MIASKKTWKTATTLHLTKTAEAVNECKDIKLKSNQFCVCIHIESCPRAGFLANQTEVQRFPFLFFEVWKETHPQTLHQKILKSLPPMKLNDD